MHWFRGLSVAVGTTLLLVIVTESWAQTMEWDGGTGNWADLNWSGGQGPIPNRPMVIDAPSDDSDVTATSDFNAASVYVGENHTARLAVNSDVTLTVANEVRVGLFGALAGNGTIGAASLTADGIIAPGDTIGMLTFEGGLGLGQNAVYRCEIGQWESDHVADPWNPVPPTGPVNDRIHATSGDVALGGTLELAATSKLHPPTDPVFNIQWYGNQTRVIASADGTGRVSNEFAAVPDSQPDPTVGWGDPNPMNNPVWSQGHIGRGVFLTRQSTNNPPSHLGISYGIDSTEVHLFQAADGDTNGDRIVNSFDAMAILASNSFPNKPLPLDPLTDEPLIERWDWPHGDFDNSRSVDSFDIIAMLAANQFGQPPYGETDPNVNPDAVDTSDVTLSIDAGSGEMWLDTADVPIGGYIVQSEQGIFTGADPSFLGLFKEDRDDLIGDSFGYQLTGVHHLGRVVGAEWEGIPGVNDPNQPPGESGLYDASDLSFIFHVCGEFGIYHARVVIVPEPSTWATLLAGAAALLAYAWRRRRGR